MAPTTMLEPGLDVQHKPGVSAPRGQHPALPALASGLLLWLAFPPAGWNWLAWIAPAFLFVLIRSPRSPRSIYFGAWLGGMLFWTLAIQWVSLTDESAWFAWIVMAFALSLWWPAFVALGRLAVYRLKLPLMIAAPILWVGLEYLRAHVLTGFPWYYLGHTQHAVLPVIQIADLTGSLGVSWLIALVNAWWIDVLTLPLLRPTQKGPRLTRGQTVRLVASLVFVLGALAYGTLRIATAQFRDGPKISVLQSNMIQGLKITGEARDIERIYKRLIEEALRDKPDLIVWPETSYPYPGLGMIDSALDPPLFARQAKELEPDTVEFWRARIDSLSRHLHFWTDDIRTPMLVGSLYHEFRPSGHAKYNSAILYRPGEQAVQVYHKIHLVPFGEYVPLVRYLPWLTMFMPHQTGRAPSLTFGREPAWADLGPYRLATAICFEDTVPHVVRRFFAEAPNGRQPDVLVNMSNDGWFHESSEHDMHLAVSVFRAVENRVPLARAVNTGVSAFIDGNGRVLESLGQGKEGVLTRMMPLDDRVTFYSAYGDWLGLSCLAATIGLVPMALTRSFLSRTAV